MRLMIDTNIILDVFLERMPFFPLSKKILSLCEERTIEGFVSASSITDIFYIVRKGLESSYEAYKVLGNILNIVKVLNVTNNDVYKAYLAKAKDFEDCLLAVCCKANNCEGIVTRNRRDFENFNIKIYSPEEILEIV